MIDWHPIGGVFLPNTQCSQNRVEIQSEALTDLVLHHATLIFLVKKSTSSKQVGIADALYVRKRKSRSFSYSWYTLPECS